MSNKVYDILKVICLKVVPFVVAVLLAVVQFFDVQVLVPVAGFVTTVNGALGVMLGISSSNYNKAKDNYGYDEVEDGEK